MHEPEPLPLAWPEPVVTVEAEPAPLPVGEPAGSQWLIPMLAGLLGAGVAIGAVLVFGLGTSNEPTTERVTEVVRTEIVAPEAISTSNLSAAVARRVTPSVVTVEVFTGPTQTGSGSGVIIDAETGYIATNEHVVQDRATVGIVLADGRRYAGEVLGVDRLTDLAVVQIEAEALVEIELGASDDLAVGDTAIAVGNPLGLLGGPTVTVGILSAFDRQVEGNSQGESLYGMLQTDAPFTSGSSGGALVDDQGRLIGITTAVGVSDIGPEGLGFATPVEVMTRVTNEIISKGFSGHGFLGIVGTTQMEPQPDGGQAPVGVLVAQLLEGSSAGASGIQAGDVIVTVDDRPVATMEGLVSALRRFSPGDQVDVVIQRQGEVIPVELELGERAEDL